MTMKVFEVKHENFISEVAKYLKENNCLTLPPNHEFMKTCHGKENSPLQDDWYYTRAGSTFRQLIVHEIKKNRPMTVARLASIYGCAKDRGSRPSKHVPATKSIIRNILRNLEALGWVKKADKGRVVTEAGKEIAEQLIEKIMN
ncbi:40S ribosomal protein S19 [Dictyocoela roeselum]|nr:40S ribosomal protein S19 [Dictyocoela roeselum]